MVMDTRVFWKLIEEVRVGTDDAHEIAERLVGSLARREVGDIVRWMQIFDEYQRASYKNKLWAAAYVINGGCSDDGFDYFRGWLTAMGKEVFFAALADPDSLVKVDVEMDEAECEDMLGVGYNAFFKKLNLSEPDYKLVQAAYVEHPLSKALRDELNQEIEYATDIDRKWDETELQAVVPALFDKYN